MPVTTLLLTLPVDVGSLFYIIYFDFLNLCGCQKMLRANLAFILCWMADLVWLFVLICMNEHTHIHNTRIENQTRINIKRKHSFLLIWRKHVACINRSKRVQRCQNAWNECVENMWFYAFIERVYKKKKNRKKLRSKR